MSGIMGIYHLDGSPVEQENLVKMVDTLAHRGPDGADICVEGSVGFGHRMLWTTPESLLEKLPLTNRTSGLTITADCRIDNREELISLLQFDNCLPEKITDSQLILAAYEKWGEECPQHLLGDFAFAIWDAREQKLFCARDHFGIKPFYYHYQPGRIFAFGSEIKALLCLAEVPRQLNELRIADYLFPVVEDKSITSYQSISRLPPGQNLTISYKKGLQISLYWSLEIAEELKLSSNQEYAEAFREIFTEAVRCRLRSAFPVSSHLSGGLDSSSVTCVARDILVREKGSQLHTFSNIFDDVPECDERPFINAVLEQGSCIEHYAHADKLGPISEWQEFFKYEDEAFIGPSHFLTWGLNRATQQAGIRISLDGFDGDTTVSHGATYFAELTRQGKWSDLIAEANAVSKHFNTSLSGIFHHYVVTYLEELAQASKWITFVQVANEIGKQFQISRRKLFLEYGVKSFARLYFKRNKSLACTDTLINPSFAQKLNLSKFLPQNQKPPVTVREQQWQTFNSALFTYSLELIDHSSAAFSIESRHPFMDKRLIEFCLALPPTQKLHQGWSRIIMRRAMDGILPPKIQWRGGKTMMTPNFLRGLLHLDQKILDDAMSNDSFLNQEFVNLTSLCRYYQHLLSGKDLTNDDVIPVWKATTLALWMHYNGIQV
ncbi:asparagine synthase (glutamine-hydrolyzing) [Calothrix sp. HK-06]|nr:asparagine synthase (glutamine-hydrolyzing) [Calothrix sp. HK-06]